MTGRKRSGTRSRGRLPEGIEIGASCHLYSGGPQESAALFLGSFTKDARRYGWTFAQRLGAFEDALVCEPRRWFRSVARCGGFRNWKSLQNEFLLRWDFSKEAASASSYRTRADFDVQTTDEDSDVETSSSDEEMTAESEASDKNSDCSSEMEGRAIPASYWMERTRRNGVRMNPLCDTPRPEVRSTYNPAGVRPLGVYSVDEFISTLD